MAWQPEIALTHPSIALPEPLFIEAVLALNHKPAGSSPYFDHEQRADALRAARARPLEHPMVFQELDPDGPLPEGARVADTSAHVWGARTREEIAAFCGTDGGPVPFCPFVNMQWAVGTGGSGEPLASHLPPKRQLRGITPTTLRRAPLA